MKNNIFFSFIKKGIKDIYKIFIRELERVFSDGGVLLIFIIAPIAYPILYNIIFLNEAVENIPIAIIDKSASSMSRDFSRKLDATRDIKIKHKCTSMQEAKDLFIKREVHGIVYIPEDFHIKINKIEQTNVSIYCDMSSFMFYKALQAATNKVMLDKSREIQINRYSIGGITGESVEQLIEAVPYEDIILYNPGDGFASFFLPAMLVMILHQTMFFGIGMLAGTAREENKNLNLIPAHLRTKGIYRVALGRAVAYFSIYALIAVYALVLIPYIFNLPHIGNIITLYNLLIPYLLATIFFSMTISVFIKNRETGLVALLFTSPVFLFLSGYSWPQVAIPEFWKYVSYLLPSTFGIQGYIKTNTMSATFSEIHFEFTSLWVLSGIYFLTTCVAYLYKVRREVKNSVPETTT